MSPNINHKKDYAKLSDEFSEKYGKLSVRLQRLQITQKSSVMKQIDEIQNIDPSFKDMDPQLLQVISAFYLFTITEEIFLVKLEPFLADIETFSRLKGHPFDNKADLAPKIIINEVFEPFIASLDKSYDTMSSLSEWMVVRYGSDWPEYLIISYAINDFFKPLLRALIEINDSVDIRFLAALGYYVVEDFITRKRRINAGNLLVNSKVSEIYELFKAQYPLSEGKDLAYDLSYKLIYKPLWPALLDLIDEEVKKLHEKIKLEREIAKKSQEREEQRRKHQYSDEYYQSAIGMRLFEIFQQEQAVDKNKEDIIIKSFDVLARRLAIDKYGYISAAQDEIQTLVIDIIIKTCKDYPQVFQPLLGQNELVGLRKASLAGDAGIEKWLDKNMDILRERFRAYLTTSGTTNISEVAKRFVNLIKRAQNAKTIL